MTEFLRKSFSVSGPSKVFGDCAKIGKHWPVPDKKGGTKCFRCDRDLTPRSMRLRFWWERTQQRLVSEGLRFLRTFDGEIRRVLLPCQVDGTDAREET